MKITPTYFFKILGTIVLTLLLLFGIQELTTFFLKQNRNAKSSYVCSSELEVETLILGPCEAAWAIDPSVFDIHASTTSYNLSATHSDFEDNLLHLHLFLKHNKGPKNLILYVSPESMDERLNTFNTFRFSAHMKDEFVAETVGKKDPDYFKWIRLPMMRMAYYNNFTNFKVVQGAKHFFQNREVPFFANGYEYPTFGPNQTLDKSVQTIRAVTDDLKWSAKREAAFIKLLEFAKSKGLKVILFEAPFYGDVLKTQNSRNELLLRINEIASEQGIPFWSFGNSDISKGSENFKSYAALSKKGSRLFSKQLGIEFAKYQ